ncbi:MAG: BON domain-containing protein [bacterium]|nr:BON domain-containing protein [bacterium]
MRDDEALREQIDVLVAETLVVDPVDLAVVVDAGVVRLEGTVDDADERAAIETRVRALSGVRAVDNRLRVRERAEP